MLLKVNPAKSSHPRKFNYKNSQGQVLQKTTKYVQIADKISINPIQLPSIKICLQRNNFPLKPHFFPTDIETVYQSPLSFTLLQQNAFQLQTQRKGTQGI